MSSPSVGKRRADADIVKLIEDKYDVTILENLNEISVKFYGPEGTPYARGVWKVYVCLPEEYPFKSPSIGFTNKIFHPNIDEHSGTICLNVINEKWTALYNLSNIFETFLPQLLREPNATDPLNERAALLYLTNQEEYKEKVIEYVQIYATAEALDAQENNSESSEMDDDEASTLSELSELDED